ncbi:MAG: hypothetical protein VX514_08700, partial [Candidatus Thermoplasmatota archaeon]|nr:hypothetical protein [Candidatus Thermoplasmatota archaeon]
MGLSKVNGSVIESYVDGDLTSVEPAVLEFDFSNTDLLRDFISYGVEVAGDVEMVSPSDADVIRIEVHNHGLHHITLIAEDVLGNEYIDYFTV